MNYRVLGVGYLLREYELEKSEWQKHGIVFDFANTTEQPTEMLRQREYVCIDIRSD